MNKLNAKQRNNINDIVKTFNILNEVGNLNEINNVMMEHK